MSTNENVNVCPTCGEDIDTCNIREMLTAWKAARQNEVSK